MPFHLVADHSALRWLVDTQQTGAQHARWAMILQEYEVVHRACAKHQNADSLSSQPLASDHDPTGARLDGDQAPVSYADPAVTAAPLTADACGIRGGGGHAALSCMAASTHGACCGDPTDVQAWAAAAGAWQLMRSDPSFIDQLAPPHLGMFQGSTSGLLDFGERELGGDDPARTRPYPPAPT